MQGRTISLATILFILSIIPVKAQFDTYSAYTRFGLGDFSKNGVGQNQAMGGTGIAMHDNSRINYLNPAAFSALDSMSVYFDFGISAFFNQYKTEDFENYWANMNLHHIVFATSMGKNFGFSTGIVPYSSIGYNIKQENNDYSTGNAIDYIYRGQGGIMNFYVGTSGKFFNRFSVGVKMNYLLGRLSRERYLNFPANSFYSTITTEENFKLKNPVFSFGVQYDETINDKYFFTLGAVYDLASDVGASNEYSIKNNYYGGAGAPLNDSTYLSSIVPLEMDTISSDLTIPQKFGFGASFGIVDKFVITGDYYMQDWSNTLSGENHALVNSSSMHFGAEYTPDIEALRGYYKLMTYRLGGYYSNTYLEVNGHQLKDYGITFGVGLPIKSRKTSFNLAFTLGSRGTTEYNLVKENYGIITFNLTLHDLWFYKRKFD